MMKTSLASVILSLILALHLANCLPSQQQQSSEQTNSLGQDSFDAYSSSSSSDGAGGLVLGLVGRPISSNNNKRARKMSAFVPMRGRKDGRDDQVVVAGQQRAQLAAINQLLAASVPAMGGLEQPMRELDGPDASLVRIVSPNGQPSWQLAPRQFASQFAIQHLLSGPQHGERPLEQTGAPNVDGGQIMEAKLRRAFHPMRGKKSDSAVDSDARELSYISELFNVGPADD